MKKNASLLLAILALAACIRSGDLRPGDAVWIQWTPQVWYHGRIERECEGGFKVRFDDQDEKCSPPSQLSKDISPTRVNLEPGMRVLAQKDPRIYAPAKILEKTALHYRVQFDDGQISEAPLRLLRLYSGLDGNSLSPSHFPLQSPD